MPAAAFPPVQTVAAAALGREGWPVAPAATYARRPPAFVNGDILAPADRRAMEAHWHAPAQGAPEIRLHAIGPVRIRFPGLVRLPDGRLLGESLHNLRGQRLAHLLARPWPPLPAAQLPGPALLLARAGSTNYGHWLVEHLGALLLLRAALPALRPHLLVNDRRESAMWQVYADSAALAGLPPEALVPVGAGPVEAAHLLVLDPGSAHPYMKHPAAIAALAALAPPRAATERLFLRRSNPSKRVLLNLDAVTRVAERLGFRIVEPGRMTLAEQIATFASAKVVAGVSGAEMTNIAFMPRGGEVVCLLPAPGRNLFFWDICCLRGHRYHAVYGPPATSRGGGHDDFTVDPALAEAILTQAVAAAG